MTVSSESPVDGIAREGRLHGRREALLGRQVDRQRDHLGSRHHDVGHLLVGEVEDLVEHLSLLLLDLARLLRMRDDHADLLLRVRDDPRRRGLNTHEPRHRVGRRLQEPHDG